MRVGRLGRIITLRLVPKLSWSMILPLLTLTLRNHPISHDRYGVHAIAISTLGCGSDEAAIGP